MSSNYTVGSTATNSTRYSYGSDEVYAGLNGRNHWIPSTEVWLNLREQTSDVHFKRSLDRAHDNMLKGRVRQCMIKIGWNRLMRRHKKHLREQTGKAKKSNKNRYTWPQPRGGRFV